MSDWTRIIALSPLYVIFRHKTNKRLFGTGIASHNKPYPGEEYRLQAGEDLLTAAASSRRIFRVRGGIQLGCTRINLSKLNAAGRKHRCLTLLISKKHRRAIAKLPLLGPSINVCQLD